MFPENAHAINVPSRNSARGSLMRGSRRGAPESSRATSASAKRICEAAMENRIETADPNASQLAARCGNGSGGFMIVLQSIVARWGDGAEIRRPLGGNIGVETGALPK